MGTYGAGITSTGMVAGTGGACRCTAAFHVKHAGGEPCSRGRETSAGRQPVLDYQPARRHRYRFDTRGEQLPPEAARAAASLAILKLLGVEWLELDRGVSLPANGQLKLLDVPWSIGGSWYDRQPALELIRTKAAQEHSTGRGILIADINSRVDFGHPALAGHLGAGYDFVTNRPSSLAALNDDQSTAGFLDDDQSTAGFLDDDQSTAGSRRKRSPPSELPSRWRRWQCISTEHSAPDYWWLWRRMPQ